MKKWVDWKDKMWIFSSFEKKLSQPSKWPNLGKFGWILAKKGPFFKFSRKTKAVIFLTPEARLSAKNKEIPMRSFSFWAKNANFEPFLAKKGAFLNFWWKAKT